MGKHVNIALFVPHAGCTHNCIFCNQKTISGKSEILSVNDVENACKTALNSGAKGGEIAFFGGSFTAIDENYMLTLLEAAYSFIKNGSFSGIRISTRPDCIDNYKLDILKKYGITAIELGCQSLDDEVLFKNARGHTCEDVVNASKLIREYGFELGHQMMTGMYGDLGKETAETVERIIEIHPDTVRVYPTIVLENTPLAKLYEKGEYVPQSLDYAVCECAEILLKFHNSGIKVIRLGLHSGGNVEDGYIAGAYHPAFRELVEGRIYRNLIEEKIEGISNKTIEVFVNSSEISKAIGQKKTNIEYFKTLGFDIKIKPCEKINRFEIALNL
ncbi:MAG TPA: radical SAM protein [Clostridiales bacterium]|nr:radical SAM protein [Clostridiales bacterium]